MIPPQAEQVTERLANLMSRLNAASGIWQRHAAAHGPHLSTDDAATGLTLVLLAYRPAIEGVDGVLASAEEVALAHGVTVAVNHAARARAHASEVLALIADWAANDEVDNRQGVQIMQGVVALTREVRAFTLMLHYHLQEQPGA